MEKKKKDGGKIPTQHEIVPIFFFEFMVSINKLQDIYTDNIAPDSKFLKAIIAQK